MEFLRNFPYGNGKTATAAEDWKPAMKWCKLNKDDENNSLNVTSINKWLVIPQRMSDTDGSTVSVDLARVKSQLANVR